MVDLSKKSLDLQRETLDAIIKKLDVQLTILSEKFDGKDGKPKFDKNKVWDQMKKTGEKSPSVAFKAMHPKELKDFTPHHWDNPDHKREKITDKNLAQKLHEDLHGDEFDGSVVKSGETHLKASDAPNKGDQSIRIVKALDKDGKQVIRGGKPQTKIVDSGKDSYTDLNKIITGSLSEQADERTTDAK